MKNINTINDCVELCNTLSTGVDQRKKIDAVSFDFFTSDVIATKTLQDSHNFNYSRIMDLKEQVKNKEISVDAFKKHIEPLADQYKVKSQDELTKEAGNKVAAFVILFAVIFSVLHFVL